MPDLWPKTLLASLLLAASISCFYLRPAPIPVPILEHRKSASEDLVVFLPGRGGHAEDFEKHGFLQVAQEAGLAADLTAVDAHLAYYMDRSLLTRLKEDVIAPAQKRGKHRIWLVGVSMGGLGALLYAERHPEDVAGVFLLAPYLGDETVLKEIRAAGGLRGWTVPEPLDPKDHQRGVWRWLKRRADGQIPQAFPIYLGYGAQDRFAPANAMLAASLPPERVFIAEGGHDWPVWRSLWVRFLQGAPMGKSKS